VAHVYDNRLYIGLDQVLAVREELFGHLRERYESMFGSRFEFLLYDVAVGLRVAEDQSKADWTKAAHGAYLLRTNCQEQDPCKLWRWYIHLTQVEDAFRVGKSDLGLRPVHHHREDRVQAHIMVCFLGLVMWRTLEQWLKAKGLGDSARQVVEQMATIHSMDVVLPVKDRKNALRLRLVGKPEKLTAELLARMELKVPTRPKQVQNVVDKITANRPKRPPMGDFSC
jgi:hypothetical protein